MFSHHLLSILADTGSTPSGRQSYIPPVPTGRVTSIFSGVTIVVLCIFFTGLLAFGADFDKPVDESKGLTVYEQHHRVQFRLDNMPLTVYRAHPTQKFPYFYPLAGPVSGQSLTTESSLPYPHHRGLWLGLDPLNGGNYWHGNLSDGRIRSVERKVVDRSENTITFTDRCRWEREGAPEPFHDQRRITVSVKDAKRWLIDVRIKLTAREKIVIKDAKHSLFAIRAAADISPAYGGTLYNSEGGRGAEGTYGQEARWCGYYGSRRHHLDIVEGIAVMTHPNNPWRPVWFTRNYGHLSPSPFNFREEPWKLPADESITLRYRVVLHAGTPEEADLDELYRQWIQDS